MYQQISRETINQVKEEANERISEVLTALGIHYEAGYSNEIRTACPCHGGSNQTAFMYNVETSSWACWTNACHEVHGYDIFGLVRGVLEKQRDKSVYFTEAVVWLATLLNVPINTTVEQKTPYDIELNKSISQLKRSKRSIVVPTQNHKDRFEPFSVDGLNIEPSKYFSEQFNKDILKKFYVGDCTTFGKPMYQRAFCLVLDEDGKKAIGVSGRTLYEECPSCGTFHNGNSGCPVDNPNVKSYPKWFHYNFCRKTTLYNIWNAKKFIKASGVAIIAEGPKDVWWLEQHGIYNSLAVMGLGLNPYHIKKLIEIGTTTLVIGLDKDEEGQKALQRIKDKCEMYFRTITINQFLKDGEDIADISNEDMNNHFCPFIKSLSNCEVKCQTN